MTFDQAPFRLTASHQSPDIDPYEFLLFALQDNIAIDPSLLQPLQEYVDVMRQGSLALLQDREKGVSNIRVEGEFLSDIFPISKIDFIGTTSPANVLTHGPTDLGGMDLHSMALLTAFLQNPAFREVTNRLTDLLGMIFDKALFYNETDTTTPNFFEHLLRHEFGNAPGVATADGMLARFTTDLQTIAREGGLSLNDANMAKALTAFAMQAYYNNRLAVDAKMGTGLANCFSFSR